MEQLRKTGLESLGDVPWGTHILHLCHASDDPLEVVVPFIAAGLEGNEYCLWLCGKSPDTAAVRGALTQAVPDLQRYLDTGQLEIVPELKWYLTDGVFDGQAVLQRWQEKIEEALARGRDGVRAAGSASWVSKDVWRDFMAYEEECDRLIAEARMMALCRYVIDSRTASDIIAVFRNHTTAIARSGRRWEAIWNTARVRRGATAFCGCLGPRFGIGTQLRQGSWRRSEALRGCGLRRLGHGLGRRVSHG